MNELIDGSYKLIKRSATTDLIKLFNLKKCNSEISNDVHWNKKDHEYTECIKDSISHVLTGTY